MTDSKDHVRLDKWLWAARIYKTRKVAQQAIEGGKVHIDGQKCKSSKKIHTGINITVRQGFALKTITVTALSEIRRSATEAEKLYIETAESIRQREKEAELRKYQALGEKTAQKPSKKQRRDLLKFKKQPME